jgi:DedD protein
MDTAMRDLERIREQDPDEGRLRQMGVWALAALVTVALVVAMAVMIGGFRGDPDRGTRDPLDALDGLSAPAAAGMEDEKVDPESLTFPNTLVHTEHRPEVSAAVAAATAELAHPEPSTGREGPSTGREAIPEGHAVPSRLPAAAAAAPTASVLARTVREDPLMARSAEQEARPVRRAPPGQDGKYTLQVISYRSADEAELFARTLRDRGHETFVVTADLPERGRHWRVRIGPFDSLAEAERYRAEFEETEGMNTFVVKRDRG